MKAYIGIDIGSTCAKTIVMDAQGRILHRILQPTGWSSVDTAQSIKTNLAELGFDVAECGVIATGYGRISVPYADKCVTEITCHGRGACYVFDTQKLTVIDIGGQDTKIICVADGQVREFIMNDKCSAGTGRFLEVMANTLAVTPGELCQLAAQGSNVSISSMCTVFAESEVISLIGRGESKENIAFGVVDSIAKKVVSQAGRMAMGATVCLTGGLCDFEYLRQRLSHSLSVQVQTHPDARYAGAIGAALLATKLSAKKGAQA
ncbi:acyl-CoA dehydratase activase [Phascolarctobacterium sp.]|uniref:acyl-CoA dehydratase activase n=1 Tax=Phascolarctobacterium sp. TaxID=2049039 RepID=UPI00386F3CED